MPYPTKHYIPCARLHRRQPISVPTGSPVCMCKSLSMKGSLDLQSHPRRLMVCIPGHWGIPCPTRHPSLPDCAHPLTPASQLLLLLCSPQVSVRAMLPVLHKYNFAVLLDHCRLWLQSQTFATVSDDDASVLRCAKHFRCPRRAAGNVWPSPLQHRMTPGTWHVQADVNSQCTAHITSPCRL